MENSAEEGETAPAKPAEDEVPHEVVEKDQSAEEVEELVLVVFSDMQFDASTKNNNDTVRNILAEKFYEAGIKVWLGP